MAINVGLSKICGLELPDVSSFAVRPVADKSVLASVVSDPLRSSRCEATISRAVAPKIGGAHGKVEPAIGHAHAIAHWRDQVKFANPFSFCRERSVVGFTMSKCGPLTLSLWLAVETLTDRARQFAKKRSE